MRALASPCSGALALLVLLATAHVAAGVVALAGYSGVDPRLLWLGVGTAWAWRLLGRACPRRARAGRAVVLVWLVLVLVLVAAERGAGPSLADGVIDGTRRDPCRGVRVGEASHPGPGVAPAGNAGGRGGLQPEAEGEALGGVLQLG